MTVLLISSYIVCRAIHICTAAFIIHNVYKEPVDPGSSVGTS